MLRNVRVKAVATEDENKLEVLPLYFDAVIDDTGNVIGPAPIFGCEGEISRVGGESMPFILYDSGKADYGLVYGSTDRYYDINLRQDKVYVGRILVLRGEAGFEQSRRVTEIKSSLPIVIV